MAKGRQRASASGTDGASAPSDDDLIMRKKPPPHAGGDDDIETWTELIEDAVRSGTRRDRQRALTDETKARVRELLADGNSLAAWVAVTGARSPTPEQIERVRRMYLAAQGVREQLKTERRRRGTLIVDAMLKELRSARGQRRTDIEHTLRYRLRDECREPAFDRLAVPWPNVLRREIAEPRRGALRVLALLSVRVGAFEIDPDPDAHWFSPSVDAEYSNVYRANHSQRIQKDRRERRSHKRMK